MKGKNLKDVYWVRNLILTWTFIGCKCVKSIVLLHWHLRNELLFSKQLKVKSIISSLQLDKFELKFKRIVIQDNLLCVKQNFPKHALWTST